MDSDTPAVAGAEARLHGEGWSIEDAKALYRLDGWGDRYFTINDLGHAAVLATPGGQASADLHDIVTGLQERGIEPPVLLRFSHILEDRLNTLHEAFATAIRENDYKGEYLAVYPTKVNEQRHIVEQVFNASSGLRFGLEVGSLPELLAVMALTAGHDDRLIICNGFKGQRFLEAILMAAKLGRRIVTVADSHSEVWRVLDLAESLGVRPMLGVRVKLSSQGAGRWRGSTGSKAKFGLFVTEMLEAVEMLRERGMLDCLQLIHCHIGSQIEDIRAVKDAIDELSRLYVELSRLGADLRYVDIGGGLGVDYDGTQTGRSPSVNYSLEEYASSIVYRLAGVCEQEGLRYPTIVSESGRAMVAHSSALMFDIIDSASVTRASENLPSLEQVRSQTEEVPQPVLDLYDTLEVEPYRAVECYHDAHHAYRSALEQFSLGFLPIEMRGLAEKLYWACLGRISRLLPELEGELQELVDVPDLLSEVYFGNFSIFQSLPDSLAIGQVYRWQAGPLHRARGTADGRRPSPSSRRRAVLRRGLSRRCLPGSPGRSAQPLWRHQRRPDQGRNRR
jgi:arginine decarboxylase